MGASALTATLVTAFLSARRRWRCAGRVACDSHSITRCMLWLSERPRRAPAQTRLAQQLLHRFVQILLCGKPRIMRGNGKTSPGNADSSTGCVFDPVLQEPCRFRGLLVVRRCIADNPGHLAECAGR